MRTFFGSTFIEKDKLEEAEIYHPIRAWRYFIMKKHIVSALSMALCLGLTAGSAVTRVTSASCKFVTHFIFLILSYLSGTMFI